MYSSGEIYQLANVLAPHLSWTGKFRLEGDAIQLREEDVQTLHTGTQRQVRTVQTGLYVVSDKDEIWKWQQQPSLLIFNLYVPTRSEVSGTICKTQNIIPDRFLLLIRRVS